MYRSIGRAAGRHSPWPGKVAPISLGYLCLSRDDALHHRPLPAPPVRDRAARLPIPPHCRDRGHGQQSSKAGPDCREADERQGVRSAVPEGGSEPVCAGIAADAGERRSDVGRLDPPRIGEIGQAQAACRDGGRPGAPDRAVPLFVRAESRIPGGPDRQRTAVQRFRRHRAGPHRGTTRTPVLPRAPWSSPNGTATAPAGTRSSPPLPSRRLSTPPRQPAGLPRGLGSPASPVTAYL